MLGILFRHLCSCFGIRIGIFLNTGNPLCVSVLLCGLKLMSKAAPEAASAYVSPLAICKFKTGFSVSISSELIYSENCVAVSGRHQIPLK